MSNSRTPGMKPNGRIKGLKEATIWQQLTYGWMTNLIWNYGREEGKIKSEMLPDLHEKDECGQISSQLEAAWEEEVKRGGRSLWRVLYKVFGRDFMIVNSLVVLDSIFKILRAGALTYFIKYLRSPEKSTGEGAKWACLLGISVVISSFLQNISIFPPLRMGYQIRVGLISLLFRKAINTSYTSSVSIGEAVNLISNDVQPFENGSNFFFYLWLGPFQLILSIGFLWLNIGVSSLVAFGVYMMIIPLQSFISSRFAKIRGNTVRFRDSRIKLLTDLLGGIEIVKLNTWEKPIVDRVTNLRENEYKSLQRANTLKGYNQALFTSSSQLVQFLTFSTLWLLVVYGSGNNIGNKGAFQPENIFPCVSIFSIMRLTMTLFVPKAFESLGEIRISVNRIESFMLLTNKAPIGSIEDSESQTEKRDSNDDSFLSDSNSTIIMKNASFSWKDETAMPQQELHSKSEKKGSKSLATSSSGDEIKSHTGSFPGSASQDDDEHGTVGVKQILAPALQNININVKRGELFGVVGPVGSGKSSLCYAILGEMHLAGGKLYVNFQEPENISPNDSDFLGSNGAHSKVNNQLKQFSKVAYSSQSPWIFGGTIRENILFGYQYEKEWFDQVVYACSLTRDFELFEDGEHTLIGERGATLSGGQRARVSLARAVYTRADLYVLDDPLSAVDPKVGRHLFENVICGLLKDKTRVLVTHQLQFIHKTDHIVLLDDGKIIDCGPPSTVSKLDEYKLADDDDESEDSVDIIEGTVTSDERASAENAEHETDNAMALSEPFDINSGLCPPLKNADDSASIAESISKYIGHKSQTNKKAKYLTPLFSKFRKSKKIKKPIPENEEYKLGGIESAEASTTSLSTYIQFLRLGASLPEIALFFLLAIGMIALFMVSDYFLSSWTTKQLDQKSNPKNVLIYFLLSFSSVIFAIATNVLMYRLILISSHRLLLKMLSSVVMTPLNFFQSQPLGRILNRFSKDQSNIDETLATTAVDTITTSLQTLGILIFICVANVYMLIVAPIVLGIFIWTRQIYIKTSRQVKQIESVTRSPVYSLLSETLDGLITVRAFSSQPKFLERFIDAQNTNSRAFFSFLGAGRWLAFRLDMINALFVVVSAFGMLIIRKSLSPGFAALSMSYILNLIGMVQWCIRQSIEVELTFISVERNIAYSNLEPEEPSEDDGTAITPPASWPHDGAVAICDLNVKYHSSNNPVLQNINMDIQPGEKVGIVGRTGAGKSSFVSSIFRLVEPYPNGCINIDQVNISDLRLNKLRSSISMIPQQPFLFEGSLRFNLDPWGEYSDEEIWAALDAASLKVKVENMPAKLESEVVENGKNFSVGERQLISMCRAILQKKKLVVMDEATANVDLETDKQIQKSVHTHFKHSTVITIAHRLHTIIGAGYDKIAVFDHGKLMEFGHPHELLKDHNSMLSKMVADTGPTMEANLRMLASKEWDQRSY